MLLTRSLHREKKDKWRLLDKKDGKRRPLVHFNRNLFENFSIFKYLKINSSAWGFYFLKNQIPYKMSLKKTYNIKTCKAITSIPQIKRNFKVIWQQSSHNLNTINHSNEHNLCNSRQFFKKKNRKKLKISELNLSFKQDD